MSAGMAVSRMAIELADAGGSNGQGTGQDWTGSDRQQTGADRTDRTQTKSRLAASNSSRDADELIDRASARLG